MAKTPTTLLDMLTRDEGYRRYPYTCTGGKLTIGIGRNLQDNGISRDEAQHLLLQDVVRIKNRLAKRYKWYVGLGLAYKVREAVVVAMVFQLGMADFHKFVNTRRALAAGDYDTAAKEMLDSAWARQTPNRARRMARQMRTGEWQ